MIDIPYGNKGLTDLYFLYKRKKDENGFIEYDINPIGRFRACDHVDFHTGEATINAIDLQHIEYLTIKTNSMYNFSRGDKIYSVRDKEYWYVSNVTVADDGQMKEYSYHPRKWTYIELSRQEVN